MLFYKALLASLVSISVVSALPSIGDLTKQLNGVAGKTPLGNLDLDELIDLEELLDQILESLEEIQDDLSISGLEIPGISNVRGVVNGATGIFPGNGYIPGIPSIEPVSRVVDKTLNAASGVISKITDGASDEE